MSVLGSFQPLSRRNFIKAASAAISVATALDRFDLDLSAQSWPQLNANGPYQGLVRTIVVNRMGHIFAGTADGVFCSTDNGRSWRGSGAGLTTPIILSLAVAPGGHLYDGTTLGGLFRSVDNGDAWQRIDDGFRRSRTDHCCPAHADLDTLQQPVKSRD